MSVAEAQTCTKPCCSGSDTAKPSMSLRRHDHGHTHADPHKHDHTHGDHSHDCGHDHSDVHAASERNYQDWLEFYNQLIKLIHKLEPKKNIEGTFVREKDHITTNASAQFRDQINKLTVYESDNKPHEMRGIEASGRPPIPNHPKRVVAHIHHLEVDSRDDRIEAKGFKHDLHASRFEGGDKQKDKEKLCESLAHMSERAIAAFSMVYMAKAKGWDKINFADTSDPMDRAMLIQACKHLGVDYGKETVGKSIVSGVTVDPMPTDFPMIKVFHDEIAKKAGERGLDLAQHGVDLLCEDVFLLFLKHPDMDVDNNIHHYSCGDGPYYDIGRHPS